MQKQLIIFDLDGTLIDSLADLADSVNAVLAAAGLPVHPMDAYRHFVGDGFATLVRRALPPALATGPEAEHYRQRMHEEYHRRWLDKTRPYQGIAEMLAGLEARGVRSAVLSNKPDPATRHITARLFPDHPFVAVRGGVPEIPLKPDPAGALLIQQAEGLSADQILYVGDTNTDMRTGRAAGFTTYGVAWGFRPVAELLESGAHAILEHPGDLLRRLD